MRRQSWVALAVVIAGCNRSDGASAPLALDDYAARFAEALCSNIGPCCQEAGFPHDPAECHASAEGRLLAQVERVKVQGGSYDPNAAGACVANLTEVARTCANDAVLDATCGRVFDAHRPSSAPCTSNAHCSAGAECRIPGDGGPAQCVSLTPPPRGKIGEPCSTSCTPTPGGGHICIGGGPAETPVNTTRCYADDGVYCDQGTRLCTPVPSLGEPCNVNVPCKTEAFCEHGRCASRRTSGTCVGLPPDACAVSAYCDVLTGECQLKKARGDTCIGNSECAIDDRCAGICIRRTLAERDVCMGRL